MKKSMLFILLFPAVIWAQNISKLELQDVTGKKFVMKKNLDRLDRIKAETGIPFQTIVAFALQDYEQKVFKSQPEQAQA